MTPSRVLSVLQRALYPPLRTVTESAVALNSFGNNLQDHCSWYGLRPLWGIVHMENMMRSLYNKQTVEEIDVSNKIVLEKAQMFLQFKNMANSRADVTVYKLYPRMDMPAGFQEITGTNPALLQNWFTSADNPLPNNVGAAGPPDTRVWPALRRQNFNEHDADITTSGASQFFRIKKVMRKFLEPGQFVILKMADRRPKIVSKQKFGIIAGDTFSANWDYWKSFGPILLFRVQGSATHNKSLATAPASNKDLQSTMSSYNVEMYIKRAYTARQHSAFITQHGMISASLPTFNVADEKGVEIRQAQVANMDIGGP